MSDLKKILKYHKALSPPQQSFAKNHGGSGEMTIKEWKAFFKPLIFLDKHNDSLRNQKAKAAGRWFGIFGLCFAVVFLSYFILLMSDTSGAPDFAPRWWQLLSMAGMVFTIPFIIVNKIAENKLKAIDIPPVINDIVFPFLTFLSEDLKPSTKVALKIDFNKLDHKKNLVLQKTLPFNKTLPYGTSDITNYEHHWFSGSVLMPNKMHLTWNCADALVRYTARKIRPSGRSKAKLKRKGKNFIQVALTAKGNFGGTSQKTIANDFKVIRKSKDSKTSVIVTRGKPQEYRFYHSTPETIKIEEFLQTFSVAFGNLTYTAS